ncbi:hypothetical protein [Devosia sp.]|uniref:hypothetical protein n=1 Tax=Devosia sp. TaxID=1871048 RepID=UPI002F24EC29
MSYFTTLLHRWRDRQEQAAVLRALEFMGPEQAAALAADVKLDAPGLRQVLHEGGAVAVLLDRMLAARGLADRAISAPLQRDLESTCARCASKTRCRRELDAGTARLHAASFCPNDRVMTLMEQRLAA